MKQYLEAGKIVTTHGIQGEVKIDVWCDSPQTLCELKTLYHDQAGARPIEILSARPHKNMALVRFRGFEGIDSARKLVGRMLYLNRDDLTLPEGEHFIADLIGIRVVDADQPARVYGTLSNVTETGAHAVYHIAMPDGKTGMVPAVKEMVISIDINAGEMRIRPVKGLLDDAD